MSAKIIFLEGPNYCGKSTITKALTEILDNEGRSFYTTYEPGGNVIGDGIRTLLLSKEINDKCEMDYTCRRLLYAASHSQMLSEFRVKLNDYDYIIVDRYNPLSDLIYGPMDESDPVAHMKKMIKSENIFSVFDNDFIKDISALVFLDISEDTMKVREATRNTTENKIYDYKGWQFKQTIRDRYEYLSNDLINNLDCPYKSFAPIKNIFMVDANGEAKEVARKIMDLLSQEGMHAN
ncbi:MAG: tmk [Herbinix sp.]|jgi:thymidylate kinase|nr:tmk [Herbinix sp.]